MYMNHTSKKHIAARVYGKVQGVFFRASTQHRAETLGLTGFVQNEKDGSVYLEAEGEPDALQQLVHWLHQGPGQARVDKVEVQETGKLQGFKTFEQRR
jgi:acylphosphatase